MEGTERGGGKHIETQLTGKGRKFTGWDGNDIYQ